MNSLLKISEAASLAMHAMAYMASRNGSGKTTNKEIALVLKASQHHLSKVLQRLTKAKLVRPIRGPKGGFILARPASDITLIEVFEAMEGRIEDSECLLNRKVCTGTTCILGTVLGDINRLVTGFLKNTKLSDLHVRYKTGEPVSRAGGRQSRFGDES